MRNRFYLICLAAVVSSCMGEVGEGGEAPLFAVRTDAVLAFEDPTNCGECHEQHVREWEISPHAYAQVDPVYLAMVKMGQRATEGKLGQFCVQCHSPPGMVTGQTPVIQNELGEFEQDFSSLDPISQKGVSCDVCHSIENVVEPFNAQTVMTPNGIRLGTIPDPIPTDAHQSAYSELHKDGRLCGSCHAVVNPRQALIEETFPEWEASSAAARGETCQTCHMPEYQGQAATDGPMRTVHRHTFVGVDVSLLPPEEFPGYHEMRSLVTELLQQSTYFNASVDATMRTIQVSIENRAGHSIPSGATAERQMWVQAIVRDASGNVVFETGTLDERGDLRTGLSDHTLVPGTDPQMIYFGQQLINDPALDGLEGAAREAKLAALTADCRPMGQGAIAATSPAVPVSMPWEANWQCNYMIPPDQTHVATLQMGALPAGMYTAEIKLNFRTFPPYFLRKLEEEAELSTNVKEHLPIVEMASVDLSFMAP